MSLVFTLKSPAESPPNKKVSLSFEALKTGTDFSSPAMKVLNWHLPTDGCFVYIEICCLLQPPSQITLPKSSGQHAAASTWTLTASSCTFYIMEMSSFLKPHEPTLLSSDFSSIAFSHLSASTELTGVRILLWIRLWTKGMLGSFDLPSRD